MRAINVAWLAPLVGVLLAAGAGGWLSARGDTPPTGPVVPRIGDGRDGPARMAWIPAQRFVMGTNSRIAERNERPAHDVTVSGFWMDVHDVTNAEFERFVAATGYVTTAERAPRWDDLKVQLPPGTPEPPASTLVPGAMVFVGTDRQVSLQDATRWWRFVPGANWRHPQGPGSDLTGKADHPVVQVSYDDASAYAAWVGKRLPTEAEWEVAARGGLTQADYAWGDKKTPDGKPMANIWDDDKQPFPMTSTTKIEVGTRPVGSFAPNGYGLYDMAGNVWQWVADWYGADYFAMQAKRGGRIIDPRGPLESFDPDDGATPPNAPKRVTRGGSFLCTDTYCSGYRTSARRGTDPLNPMSHIGFRLVMTPEQWAARAVDKHERPTVMR
ncbi:formylglycine-generating enzyme family protein [Pandoraea pneumonica]|uniref:formylglycine-generating enzyme family protein n=1 Tax=Pandoraea pneumonica TaxID=2508299 RepID=UPI001FE41387|nr:formylglycine-generating enzyme family protein [Pandoraea pneumonica]